MMGLLGNVAEVPNLRQKLMTKAFVAEFAQLLDSSLDGIEVIVVFENNYLIKVVTNIHNFFGKMYLYYTKIFLNVFTGELQRCRSIGPYGKRWP
jgi:hypothetical protein